jgi:hypothetical protein
LLQKSPGVLANNVRYCLLRNVKQRFNLADYSFSGCREGEIEGHKIKQRINAGKNHTDDKDKEPAHVHPNVARHFKFTRNPPPTERDSETERCNAP